MFPSDAVSLLFTAGLMVKKSASDVSISSGTHGQYSILQTAKLLPGAPQQPVSPLLGSQESGQHFRPVGVVLHPKTMWIPFQGICNSASLTRSLPTALSPHPLMPSSNFFTGQLSDCAITAGEGTWNVSPRSRFP